LNLPRSAIADELPVPAKLPEMRAMVMWGFLRVVRD
jgi:hypothetical protein